LAPRDPTSISPHCDPPYTSSTHVVHRLWMNYRNVIRSPRRIARGVCNSFGHESHSRNSTHVFMTRHGCAELDAHARDITAQSVDSRCESVRSPMGSRGERGTRSVR